MRKKIARHSMRWTFILIFVSLVFVAFFTGFARVGLPFVGAYRAEIQNYVSSFLDKNVEIGALDMSWQKFGPRLVLHDVILDSGADSSQNVDLKKIYFDLDLLRSWLNGAWQINEVSIVGAKLSFDYYDKQKIRVYGENIDTDSNTARSSSDTSDGLDVLSWLMQADRVGLLDSSVTLRHIKKDFNVEVRDLNIRVNNQDGVHQIRIDLQVPSMSEERVAMNLDFTGEREELIHSAGVFNLSMKEIDLGITTELFGEYLPLSVKGKSDLALSGEWSNGEVNSLRIQSTLGQSEWLNKATQTTLNVPASWSDWVVVKNSGEYRLALNKLELNNVDEDLDLFLRVTPEDERRWWLNARGENLELSAITPAMQLLSGVISEEVASKRILLDSLSGGVRSWHIQASGQQGQFPIISADATLSDVSIGDDEELPGFKGVDAHLSMRNNSGSLRIVDENLSVNLPKWFNAPQTFSSFETNLGFRIDQDRFVVQSDKVLMGAEGLSAAARVKIQKNVGYDAYIDVEAEASDVSVANARRFFPEKIMKPKLINWLDNAILAGDISNAHAVIKGSSKEFPYANGEGVFNADFDFSNGKVKAINNWPHVNVLAASVEFRQNSMDVEVSRANTQGNELSRTTLSIDDFKRPVIKLHGRAKGDIAGALDYIRNSSLKDPLEVLVKTASGIGKVALDLDLTAALYNNSPPISFDGKVLLQKGSWGSKELGLSVNNINGFLSFSENSLITKGITAETFNSPVTITANIDKNNPNLFSRIYLTGNIATEAVLENYNLPVSHWFKGSSPWSLQLELKRAADTNKPMRVSLLAKSDLVGTLVDLPEPYGKTKNKKGQLSANIYLNADSKGQNWNFSYASHLRARIVTKPHGEGLKALAIRFNEPLPPITQSISGMSVQGRVSELPFDGWVSSIADVIARIDESDNKTPIMPVQGKLLVDDMVIGKIRSGQAQFAFATDDKNVSTIIDSKWLAGDLHYPRQYWLKEKSLKSRLSLLDKRFLDALATAEGDDQSRIDPRDFPPMELVIDKFVWDEYHVADLNMRTSPVTDGMKTTALGFVHSDLQMSGDAYWRLLDPQNIAPTLNAKHRTDISFSLKSDDVGAGLDGVGVVGAFSGGQGEVDVSMAWNDAAYAPDLTKIAGTIKPRLKTGHILAVEPGAAKILGLFALQAIPRRLLLDFNDVTKDGLLYDEISGDIAIADGIATTNYMQLNGPIGVVSSSGLTDFVNSTYDQQIVVLPRLTSALPIIGLLSAGATAGVGVLVADQILKGVGVNFDEVGKREYRLTGSWDDPQIRRVHVPIKHLPEPENR